MISITSTDFAKNGRTIVFISIIGFVSWNHAENHKVKTTNTPSDFLMEYATRKPWMSSKN